VHTLRIDIDDSDAIMDEGERLYFRGVSFTGAAVEYQRGALVSLVTYTRGIEDGPFREWYMDGLRPDGIMRDGFPVGECQQWHPNGRIAARAIMTADGLSQLAQFEWGEQGKLMKEWHADSAVQLWEQDHA
jgi:antitoxin component YwqK of YwqJK toxin-antitoxin module